MGGAICQFHEGTSLVEYKRTLTPTFNLMTRANVLFFNVLCFYIIIINASILKYIVSSQSFDTVCGFIATIIFKAVWYQRENDFIRV